MSFETMDREYMHRKFVLRILKEREKTVIALPLFIKVSKILFHDLDTNAGRTHFQ